MFQAAKWGDLVIGIDMHMVMVPAVPAPVPVPMPHVFIGIVFDVAGALISAAITRMTGVGGPVYINGMLAANTGTDVRGLGHSPTPPGTAFAPNDIPDNEGTLITGSKTVKIMGTSAARLTSAVASCNYPVNLPTSMCMALPMGAPVSIGGPTAVDYAAAVTRGVRTKWVSHKAHSILKAKPGSRVSKAICFMTGHPVDVMTGEVLTDAVDFTLPGWIPIVFERNYYSRSHDQHGPLGPGWHHPLDVWLDEKDEEVHLHLPDGRMRKHDMIDLAEGKPYFDEMDHYTLQRSSRGYCLTTKDRLRYHLSPVPKARVSHSLVRIMDLCENFVDFRYERGLLVEVTDSAGRKLVFAYAQDDRLVSIRLRAKDAPASDSIELVSYRYDEARCLSEARDPNGNGTRYAYKGGVLVQETNRNGLSFYFEYDSYEPDGDCIHTWGDGGLYERWIKYDHLWNFTTVVDSRGGKTRYWGNPAGVVEKMMDATNCMTRYEWHRTFQKSAEIDEMGNRTEWDFDDRGNLIAMRDALKHETRVKYNELDLPVEVVDPNGGAQLFEWDRRGKLKRAVDELGYETDFRHERTIVAVQDATGRSWSVRCDAAGLPVEIVDREGNKQTMEWDLLGRLYRHVDALGGETVLFWDACSNLQRVRRPDGSTTVQEHDAEGNTTEHTDPMETTTRYRYAGLNQLVEQMDLAGGVIRFSFDTEENLIGVTNEHGEEYKIEVDPCGRVLKEIGFDGRETGYRYDRAGRCCTIINAFNRRTKIERDANGRIIKRVVPRRPWFGVPIPKGEEFTYEHDPCGRVILAKNATATVAYKRDARGDVIEERVSLENEGTGGSSGVADHVITSRYDAVRNRIERRTSLGHTTQYDFDGNGDLLGAMFGVDPRWLDFAPESLRMGGPPIRAPWKAVLTRNAAGAETERRLPGGVVSRWERDRWGRPHVHRLMREDVQVSAIGYQWRTDEQLAALIDTQAGATRFTHDARSYLVAAVRPDGSVQHRAADPAGNIFRTPERTDRTYGRGGRLVKNDGVRHVYNVEGQLIQKVLPDGSKWEYDWDWAERLEQVTRPDGTKVTFAYDPFDRRIRKTCGDRTTHYVWDGDEMVHELTDGEPLITWEFEPGTFAPMAKIEGEKRYSIVTDHLGTPQAMLDQAGEVVWQGELDLYGVLHVEIALIACPWRWPGQYEDVETGLFYNRFRFYDPQSGEYISQDPIGFLGGLTLYAYVNDPLIWIDPFGWAKKCGAGKYKDVGGHHIHAKAGFKDHPLYLPGDAFAISYEYMGRYSIVHERIFLAQRRLFKEMVARGAPNTMAEHSRIALEALIHGYASRAHAEDLVAHSLDSLLTKRIIAPTNIPWGPKR